MINQMNPDDSILPDQINSYLFNLLPERPDPVRKLEKRAEGQEFPIVGPLVGQFLKLFTSAINPKRIIEMGSGFGYSAYWFAKGAESPEIHLTDYDEQNLRRAQSFLGDCNFSADFHYYEGDARDYLRNQNLSAQCVFIDIDKSDYPEALLLAHDTLDSGGWIIADNVLWDGKVASEKSEDLSTQSIKQFNRQLNRGGWESTIVPIRDGVAVAQKVND